MSIAGNIRSCGNAPIPERAMAMKSIVEIDSVTRVFGGKVTAVDDVSLDVGEGEFITLLGPSGCGKTTLLRILAGFELPDRGSIRLDGQDVTFLPPYRRDVNMVFQDYALFPHLSVGKNIAFGLERQKLGRAEISKQVDSALQLVGLSEMADRMPHQLSGGQRQRVALARAVVRRPRVLLLDEPLSALDANLREAMQVELKHLHQKLGITFIMVTHDQIEALVMSDRIVVMDRGRIAQAGTPSDLYDRPASTYVASFVGTSNFLAGTIASVSGGIMFEGQGIELRCPLLPGFTPGQRVTLAVRPERLRIASAAAGEINLIRCVVEERLFHGNGVRLRCRMASGDVLLCDRQLSASSELSVLPAAGQTVELAVDPESIALFPEDRR
jgi:putative spermidine/putrescine transport system ATP-binding protein/spermidine/putrescine transport system ATP-binding protein